VIWAMVKPSSSLGRPGERHFTLTPAPPARHEETDERDHRRERHDADSPRCGSRLVSFLGQHQTDAIRLTFAKDGPVPNRYEKKPIVSHGASPPTGRGSSRIRKPFGKSQKHTASTAPPASCVTAPNRQQQPHADIHMQESEGEQRGAGISLEESGAKAGRTQDPQTALHHPTAAP